MNTDLTVLRAIAEAATPGPWEWEPPQETEWPQGNESLVQSGSKKDVLSAWGYDASGTMASDEDRAHIAAFDPPTVLALLDRADEVTAALQRVKALAEYWASLAPADQHYAHQLLKTLDPKGRNS